MNGINWNVHTLLCIYFFSLYLLIKKKEFKWIFFNRFIAHKQIKQFLYSSL